jgi:hypothetical protein
VKRIQRSALPRNLAASIPQGAFLCAFDKEEKGRFVVWHVTSPGHAEELEYDAALDRPLTIAERTAELPAGKEQVLPQQALRVVSRYFIDKETSKLRVTLHVMDASGVKIAEAVQDVYDPFEWTLEGVVRSAVQQARFSAEYAAWPRDQKVAYWAASLRRLRRAAGESGADEDSVYSPSLIQDMEKIDPQVIALLPDILGLVAGMDQIDAAQAVAAFSAGTGVALPAPSKTGGQAA